jgi:hypothetical protein
MVMMEEIDERREKEGDHIRDQSRARQTAASEGGGGLSGETRLMMLDEW